MKFLSIIFILCGLSSTAVFGADGGDRDGSTGTSGGADYKVDPVLYLPKHISIKEEREFAADRHYMGESDPEILEWKPCWGIPFFPKCPFYAKGTVSTFEFDRDRMHSSDLGMSGTFKFVRPNIEKNVQVPSNLVGLDLYGMLIITTSKLFPEKTYAPRGLRSITQVDGETVSDLQSVLSQVFDKIFATIDLNHPETFVPVFELRSVLEKLGLEKFLFDQRVASIFSALVKAEGDHWYSLAKAVATEQKCEPSAYSHFVQGYRQWDTGSAQYFAGLAQQLGLRFSSEVTGQAISTRTNVRQLVLNALSECVLFIPVTTQTQAGGELRDAADGSVNPVFEGGDTH